MSSTSPHLISFEIDAFIVDRRARQRSKRTIEFYEDELGIFRDHLATQHVLNMDDITTTHIRQFMVDLGEHRNKGGVHASYRSLKAFIRWYAEEIEDDRYYRLIKKITPPSPSKEPLPGVSLDHVNALLDTCPAKNHAGQRDRSIIITLLDTGVRRSELVALDFGNVNLKTGAVQIYNGKGDKNRTVYLGNRSTKELIRYLRYRPEIDPTSPLYTSLDDDTRLTPDALRDIIRRHARAANIPEPGLHDFRRTYAIESLRNGIDIVTLMHLMGHTTTTVLQRYLKLVENDLRRGHEKSSPADNL
jgi:site-specific recombinase XerD